jgi:signal transduction histidine kinase
MRVPGSLQVRLLLAGLAGVLLAALAASLLLGQAFAAASQRAFDRQLGLELDGLIALGEVDEQGAFTLPGEPEDDRYTRLYSGHYWRVVDADRAYQSRSLWDGGFAIETRPRPGPRAGSNSIGPAGEPLRVISQTVRFPGYPTPVMFAVAADRRELASEARDFRLLAGGAVGVLALLLISAIAWQVRWGLRPLLRLADTVAAIRRGEVTRFPTVGMPSEIAPLASHLNELLDHHDRLVTRARSAAGDLAHALKTPLSVLAIEASRSDHAMGATIQNQILRMQDSVERHLGAGLAPDPRERTPVTEVAGALLTLMERLHATRGIGFVLEGGPDVRFAGSRSDLEEMLGNLLDNAGKWARTVACVGWSLADDRLRLWVADDGPGLPALTDLDVTERGVRLDQRVPGSGLGLAIVREIAMSYGGTLTLESTVDGLRAELTLPGE